MCLTSSFSWFVTCIFIFLIAYYKKQTFKYLIFNLLTFSSAVHAFLYLRNPAEPWSTKMFPYAVFWKFYSFTVSFVIRFHNLFLGGEEKKKKNSNKLVLLVIKLAVNSFKNMITYTRLQLMGKRWQIEYLYSLKVSPHKRLYK